MGEYRSKRGIAVFELVFCLLFGDGILIFLSGLIDGYIEKQLIGLVTIIYTIWCMYYILLDLTLKYIIEKDKIIIHAFWGMKNIKINFDEINGLLVKEKYIDGFKLSGIGKQRYAFGRMVVEGIGTTRAFITSSEKVIYIHTENLSYGISPVEIDKVLTFLFDKSVPIKEFKIKNYNSKELFENKLFLYPLIITTIVVILMTALPFILYIFDIFPEKMPLSFNANLMVVLWGNGKQFAFKQMMYGVFNMIILTCMYYASYFTAKYDKKLAIRYMYMPLSTTFLFSFIQVQILINYL